MTIRIVHDYHSLGEQPLAGRAFSVAALMLTATYTVTSKVTAVILKAQAQALLDAIVVCATGTPEDTILKNQIMAALLALLDTLANDVENAANEANNSAIVPAFGFTLANTSHTPVAAGPTGILGIANTGPGGLHFELLIDPPAWCYLVEDTLLPNGPVKITVFTDPSDVNLAGLGSGSMHSFRACTMVAKNKYGPWCEPVQHMST